MAKPRIDLPPAQAVRALADAQGRLALRVTPGARSEGLEIAAGKLIARVRARPQDGAANDAVIALVARALGSAPSHVAILRGQASREKLLQLPPG